MIYITFYFRLCCMTDIAMSYRNWSDDMKRVLYPFINYICCINIFNGYFYNFKL